MFGVVLQRGLPDGLNLLYRKFAREDGTTKTKPLKFYHLLGRTVVALGGCVQTDRRKRLIEQLQVLNNKCIHPRFIQLPSQADGRLHFIGS